MIECNEWAGGSMRSAFRTHSFTLVAISMLLACLASSCVAQVLSNPPSPPPAPVGVERFDPELLPSTIALREVSALNQCIDMYFSSRSMDINDQIKIISEKGAAITIENFALSIAPDLYRSFLAQTDLSDFGRIAAGLSAIVSFNQHSKDPAAKRVRISARFAEFRAIATDGHCRPTDRMTAALAGWLSGKDEEIIEAALSGH